MAARKTGITKPTTTADLTQKAPAPADAGRVVSLTSPAGTKVTVPAGGDLLSALKAAGFTVQK